MTIKEQRINDQIQCFSQKIDFNADSIKSRVQKIIDHERLSVTSQYTLPNFPAGKIPKKVFVDKFAGQILVRTCYNLFLAQLSKQLEVKLNETGYSTYSMIKSGVVTSDQNSCEFYALIIFNQDLYSDAKVQINFPTIKITEECIDSFIEKLKIETAKKTRVLRAAKKGDVIKVTTLYAHNNMLGLSAAEKEPKVFIIGYDENLLDNIGINWVGRCAGDIVCFTNKHNDEAVFLVNDVYEAEGGSIDELVNRLQFSGDDFRNFIRKNKMEQNIHFLGGQWSRVILSQQILNGQLGISSTSYGFKEEDMLPWIRLLDETKKHLPNFAELIKQSTLDKYTLERKYGKFNDEEIDQVRAKDIVVSELIAKKGNIVFSPEKVTYKEFFQQYSQYLINDHSYRKV